MKASVLGFGCGSVLGRVGRGTALRAMHTAWELGINLFDTARSYGYGNAEAVLGEFLRGKREQAVVTTKFGIDPAKRTLLRRVAVPMARAALKAPGIGGLLRRGRSREVPEGRFSVPGLRLSIETSLRQLGTDRVEVLFLHEATAAALHQEDLFAELDALVQAGKVLRVGIYAGSGVIAECMVRGPRTVNAAQFGADPFDTQVPWFMDHRRDEMLFIANHPFGGDQRMLRLKTALAEMGRDANVPIELREKLRDSDWPMLLEAILGMVVLGTEVHSLVFSMMREDHLRANAHAIESCRFTEADLAAMRKYLLPNTPHR